MDVYGDELTRTDPRIQRIQPLRTGPGATIPYPGFPDCSATLVARQRRFYRHRCDIWRATEVQAADGNWLGKSWTQVARGVCCYFESTASNFALNGAVILSESDNIFTLDIVHLEASVDLRAGDVLKMTQGYDPGRYWAVRGNAQPKTLWANKASFRAAILELPPVGVG